MDSSKLWLAFGIGVATGAAIALVYAPQTGEKTRRQLKRNFEDASERIQDTVEGLGKHVDRTVRASKEVVESVKSGAEWAAHQVAQVM